MKTKPEKEVYLDDPERILGRLKEAGLTQEQAELETKNLIDSFHKDSLRKNANKTFETNIPIEVIIAIIFIFGSLFLFRDLF